MDYNISQVEQNPSGIGCPFNMERNDFVTLQLFTNLLPDSLNLAGAVSATNNKIVSKGANLLGIQHDYIVSLFIRSRLHRQPRYVY